MRGVSSVGRPAVPLGLCAGVETDGAKPCTKEGSKMGVPPGSRGVRRPVKGGAGPGVETRGPRCCRRRRHDLIRR